MSLFYTDRRNGPQGSVLWQDEMNEAARRGSGGDISIDVGGAGAHFQDQMQAIEDQVTKFLRILHVV